MLDTSNSSNPPHEIILPGTLLKEECCANVNGDHPDFSLYLQRDPYWVRVSQIMDCWTEQPIQSFEFKIAYPLIAVTPNKQTAQAIHVLLNSSWRPTSKYALCQKLDEWEKEQVEVLLVSGKMTWISPVEIYDLEDRFGKRFHSIALQSYSRFDIVYDTKKRILLVRMGDDKILRTYQGL